MDGGCGERVTGVSGSISWVQRVPGEGGSRKTKDLRRLPRGVRAGGLPASVHSSAGGRRGLPRWRVRGSGGEDDVGWQGEPWIGADAREKRRRPRRKGGPRRAKSSKFGYSARAGCARQRARAMAILYLRPSGRAPRNYPGWCRLAHQPGSLAHQLGVWGDKGSWHLWEGTETEKHIRTSANTPTFNLFADN